MRLISFLLPAVIVSTPPALAQDPAVLAERTHRLVQQAVEAGETPGLSVTVILPSGERIDAQAGLADPREGDRVGSDTRFLSGSTGKTVTALLAVQLAGDGVLDLDAPVSTWLSERDWWQQLQHRNDITLRMLLNHSAGIPDYLEDIDFFLAGLTRGRRGYSPDELVGFVAGDAPEGIPGGHYAYSDTHFILAGMIIEAATGEDFYDLAQARIVEPLGLADTEPLQGRHFERLAAGHRRGLFGRRATARGGELSDNPDHEWTAGGWVTTPGDLARLFRALGEDGAFATEGAVMRTDFNAFDETGHSGYGLGLFVRRYEDGSYRIAHGGDFAGYRASAIHDTASGITLAVMGNTKAFEAPDFAFELLAALKSENP
jgi:D-alanyl-D-alanine carboxypeptidase